MKMSSRNGESGTPSMKMSSRNGESGTPPHENVVLERRIWNRLNTPYSFYPLTKNMLLTKKRLSKPETMSGKKPDRTSGFLYLLSKKQ